MRGSHGRSAIAAGSGVLLRALGGSAAAAAAAAAVQFDGQAGILRG